MNILIVNQGFYPDGTAGSQYITDFAEDLVSEGYRIDIISGIYDYEKPNIKFLKKEKYRNVNIHRIGGTNFKAKKLFPRTINLFTYLCILFIKLFFSNLKQYDIIIGTSSPPLSPLITSIISKLKRKPFVYWCLDLQPDVAIAMKLIKKNSILAKILFFISKTKLNISTKIVVLDEYMKKKVVDKGIDQTKVISLPLWSTIPLDKITKNSGKNFRKQYNLDNKFVIMYSGNHSFCHPLDTLLNAAVKLKNDSRFLFLFIGSGVRCKDVENIKKIHTLSNVIQLPYQPRDGLVESLCAADIQIAVMGNNINGLLHPSKSYSIIGTGKPFIFIGPQHCYINDLINMSKCGKSINHNEIDLLIEYIKFYYDETLESKNKRFIRNNEFIKNKLSRKKAIDSWQKLLTTISLKN
jgi:putative colanic acid biosynthesis glycosyltransferase WcaI